MATASRDDLVSPYEAVVQVGDMERVAVVAILRVVPVRGWERLPRGAAVYAVHVGHGSTCHAAGIEEDAVDLVRVQARATGSKRNDLRGARVAIIVGDEGRGWTDRKLVVTDRGDLHAKMELQQIRVKLSCLNQENDW